MPDAVTAICRLLAAPTDARTDGELLIAFRSARDEPAFAELLRRHGPMVLAACRRLLPDPADAEDAFQAAFLVLVRRAGHLGCDLPVGPWLHRVAVLTARSLRRRNARRLARQCALSETTPDPSPGPSAADLRIDLDAALLALPEKLRVPLVLCHLQGWTRRDAAERLGCPEGTLSSLLARALARLRARFPGLDPARTLAVPALAVPAALSTATVRAAAATIASPATISLTVSQLAEGVIRMFWVKKTTAAVAALAVVFGLGVGVGVSVRQVPQAGALDPTGDSAAQPQARNPAGASQDLAAELAELRKRLAAAEDFLKATQREVDRAKVKLADSEKLGNLKAIAEARETLTQSQQQEDVAAAECQVLRAQIAELEARLKAAPRDPRAATPAADDIEKQLADAKKRLDQLRDQSTQLQQQSEELKAQAAELQDKIKLLEAQRERDKAAGDPRAAPGGAAIEVRVSGDMGVVMWPYSVREYRDGKLIGTLACDNTEVLRVTLTRMAKDPTAPKELHLVVDPNAPYDRLKAVLEACKAAGFKEAKISGIIPVRVNRTTTPTVPRREAVDVNRRFHDEPATIDSLLNGLPPRKP
ncbi:MAG TPA: sigma-70 family RNA polymerase sigma factor [Gemmataceae bacterium]|nr:sigma-70 family RNA polymerase sigma factor [Gemmataceae bacterium]